MIKIRRASNHEAAELTDLSMRAKRSNGYDDVFMEACREELTVTVSHLKAGEYWVAEADVVFGCACLLRGSEGATVEVHAFFIDPDWQRQGVGRLLWQKVFERARTTGAGRIYLAADPAAVSFYQAMGFVIVGETPSGSIRERMLPVMEIQLA